MRIHDALLSRLSNDDSIESGLSTFAKEMRQMSLILAALPSFDKCLVIIDELGRGTAPHEGVGIAHALAERVSRLSCVYLETSYGAEEGRDADHQSQGDHELLLTMELS
jgi:DNA mismatch repair protein MSH4